MEFLRNVALILHFIGLAGLLGGIIVQIKAIVGGTARITPAIFHGGLLQLLSGLVLVGILEMTGSPDHIKITVKTAILVAILVVTLIYRKKETAPRWPFITIGALTIANIAIAVVW